MSRSSVFVWEQLLKDNALTSIHPDLRHKYADALTVLGIRLLRSGARGEAREVLRSALVQRPTLRPALGVVLGMLPQVVVRAVVAK